MMFGVLKTQAEMTVPSNAPGKPSSLPCEMLALDQGMGALDKSILHLSVQIARQTSHRMPTRPIVRDHRRCALGSRG